MISPERENTLDKKKTFTLKEKATLKMAESMMSNYKDAQLAVLDLVDNCVDNRTEDKKLSIKVTITRDFIVISNIGGQGLDQDGLQDFLMWGHSDKSQRHIGQYGVGGKAAMGFLGKSIEVRCSQEGSREEYRLFDPDWETKSEESEKEHEGEIRTANTEDGYFQVRISGLKRKVQSEGIINHLGDIYRPLINEGKVSITVNNKVVSPLEIKYVEDDPELKPDTKFLGTVFGDKIKIKVGILEPGQKIKPGIRCYYRGRLVEAEQFFGQPTPARLAQASRLIGEAHLDFLSVTTNKSNFIKDDNWEETGVVIHRFLDPWIKKLEGIKIDRSYEVEEYEEKITKEVKRAFEHILAHNALFTREDLPGSSSFRLPPTIRGDKKVPTGRIRRSGERGGATSPDLRADVGPNVKRWGPLFEWKSVPMGISDKRADVVEIESKEGLRINTDFPGYQAAKKAGRDALWLYQAETAAIEILKLVHKDKPVEFYVEEVNKAVALLFQLYYDEKSRFSSRGSISFSN